MHTNDTCGAGREEEEGEKVGEGRGSASWISVKKRIEGKDITKGREGRDFRLEFSWYGQLKTE